MLIRNYRVRGHMIARVDPLGMPRPVPPELDPRFHGLGDADLDRLFSTHSLPGPDVQPLREIIDRLRHTYCGSISAQFMSIDDLAVREWLQRRMEDTENRTEVIARRADPHPHPADRRGDLRGIHPPQIRRGQDLFAGRGGKPDPAAGPGHREGRPAGDPVEIVMGMAHRGRLNVLANIIGKSPQEIFREFEDIDPELVSRQRRREVSLGLLQRLGPPSTGQKIHLSLCFNPSHLEFVNPVALGLHAGQAGPRRRFPPRTEHGAPDPRRRGVRRRRRRARDAQLEPTARLHEWAARCTSSSTTRSASPPRPTKAARRSTPPTWRGCCKSPSSTSTAKHPEAVAQVIDLAMDFRKTFHRDVVIDMYCYRRWGHNEGDEPSFTQPLLYKCDRAPQTGPRRLPGTPA